MDVAQVVQAVETRESPCTLSASDRLRHDIYVDLDMPPSATLAALVLQVGPLKDMLVNYWEQTARREIDPRAPGFAVVSVAESSLQDSRKIFLAFRDAEERGCLYLPPFKADELCRIAQNSPGGYLFISETEHPMAANRILTT